MASARDTPDGSAQWHEPDVQRLNIMVTDQNMTDLTYYHKNILGNEKLGESIRHLLNVDLRNIIVAHKRAKNAQVLPMFGPPTGKIDTTVAHKRATTTICNTNLSEKLELKPTEKPASKGTTPWPEKLVDIKQTLETLGVYESWLIPIAPARHFADPEFWAAIDAWMDTVPDVYYLDELKAYVAHQQAQSLANRHKDPRRGFRNWLATAKRWRERDAERKAIQTRR